jgi:putative peptidoglycan lipid II flippase
MQTTRTPPQWRPSDTGTTPPPPATAGQKMYSAAAIVAAAFVASRVLGLAREVIIAARFGTTGEYDAYVAAFKIPDLLFQMVMAGAFGSAFVPVFTGYLGQGQVRKAWRLASNVITIAVEAALALAVVVFVAAGPLVRLTVARGLPPADQALAVEMTRILLLSPIFLGLGAAAKGILESTGNFTNPALAPVTYNAAVVAGALFLAPRYGVKGLAYGVVAGSIGHLLTQFPGLLRSEMRYWLLPRPVAEGLGTVGRLLVPRVIGLIAYQVNFIVITSFASLLGVGAISALNYAYQVMMLPHGVFAISVATVIFPAMARQYAARDFAALKMTLGDALRPLLFLTLPASAALMILARPIVQTLFQFRSFSEESTALVAQVLPYFAAGLIALAIVETTTRAYYAMHDTRTPLIASGLTIAINIVAAWLLAPRLGDRGLAASISVTTGLEMLILLAVLRRRIGPFDAAVWRSFVKSVLATGAMAAVLLLIRDRLIAVTDPRGGKSPWQVAIFLFAVGVGLYTYLAAAWYLKAQELTELAQRFGGPLRRLRVTSGE